MADYPMLPQRASTPRTPKHVSPDPVHVGQLLATLEAIPRSELPDGIDRNALAMLIRYGFVDNLYTPFGHAEHVIAWAHRPADMDPRERIADWLAARREWERNGKLPGVRGELKRWEEGDE